MVFGSHLEELHHHVLVLFLGFLETLLVERHVLVHRQSLLVERANDFIELLQIHVVAQHG